MSAFAYDCPRCAVMLDDDGAQVRCWKCGWTVRDVDAPREYHRLSEEVRDMNEFMDNLRRRS